MSANSWDGIEEFAAVAVTGSFTAGSRMLGMSVTHMSRSVAQLEARLQARLFDRTTRTVKLTDTGRIFLDHCQRLISERDVAIALVSEGEEPQGELRITCSTAMGERFVAPISLRFQRDHPKVRLAIELTNRLVDLFAEGFDLAIRTGPLSDPRLIGTEIARRQFITCAAPAYLAERGRPERINDLDRHECLIGSASSWHFQVNGTVRIFRPQGRWRCNSGTAVVDAAIAGLGLCQLPEFYVLEPIADGRLEPILQANLPPSEPIWAVHPQRRHVSPKIGYFIERLRTELPSMLSGPRG